MLIQLGSSPSIHYSSVSQEEYSKSVSQFKLEKSIKDEVGEFTGGLHEVSCVQMIMCSFDRDDIHLQVTTRKHRANSNKSLAIF